MVGFGSSLRMARRPGWEGAYLDYETLKLLLSQIESIYEEEAQRSRDDGVFLHEDNQRGRTQRDFRADLFLESDSDLAYPSADEERLGGSRSLKETIEQQQGAFIGTPGRSFALSYSLDTNSSSEDDERVRDAGCGGTLASWMMNTKADTNVNEGQNSKKRQTLSNAVVASSFDSEDYYVGNNNRSNGNAFILEGREGDEFHSQDDPESSILSAPVKRTYADERSSLLAAASKAQSGTVSTFAPFASLSSEESQEKSFSPVSLYYTNNSTINPLTPKVPRQASSQAKNANPNIIRKLQEERERDRIARRARRERRKKMREDRIPRRLRRAHAKARAITERFIGLLNAECEKVELFALARLGELVETAGSLRFPSFDDEYGSFQQNNLNHRENTHYLADRGLHPSDSSSSDGRLSSEGQGLFPWSDSSDGDANSHKSERLTRPMAFSCDNVGLKPSALPANRMMPNVPDTISGSSGGKKLVENSDAVRQQIAHFTALRQERTIFQKNDLVLGEDMLFLSAGEEVDGYTAVGVELLHVLRYICVNLVAVRKICRKHDRLLMNRMLGGYYQRLKIRLNEMEGQSDTLGESVTRVSQTTNKEFLGFLGNSYKLVGNFDQRIQSLAESQIFKVISSCLASALSEYEISRSRADAMTKLNSGTFTSVTPRRAGGFSKSSFPGENDFLLAQLEGTDDANTRDAPTTASSISLTRLEFTVTVIYGLLDAAREKHDCFSTYVSRTSLSFCGYFPPSEGLDGCSRETLDFLVSYNPDSALLQNIDVLFEGLKRGKWRAARLEDLFTTAIVASLLPEQIPLSTAKVIMAKEQEIVAHALRIKPSMSTGSSRLSDDLEANPFSAERVGSLPRGAFLLSKLASFLYMMNYFMAHATSNIFVMSTGSSSALAATIIGAPNAASILTSFCHCYILSGEPNRHRPRYNLRLYKVLFGVASIFAIFGNLIHAHAVSIGSVRIAIFGRFVFGLSTTEILQRQILSTCSHSVIIGESASLVQSRVVGTVTGLFFGAFIEALPVVVNTLGVRFLRSSNWMLIALWMCHLVATCLSVREFKCDPLETDGRIGKQVDSDAQRISDGSSSESDTPNPTRMLYGIDKKNVAGDPATTFSTENNSITPKKHDNSHSKRQRPPESPKRKRSKHLRNFGVRIRKLLDFHKAIPVSLFVLFVASFGIEAFFTGTPLITNRYFGWSGAQACSFLGLLSCSTFAILFVCERVTRGYEDRAVIKRSIVLVVAGLLVTVNWVSIIYLAARYSKLLEEMEQDQGHEYDWNFGAVQYIIGLCLIYAGGKSLESAAFSMLSKFSPPNLRSVVINVGTIATFLTLIARVLANLQVSMVGLSNKLINTDMVNALSLPLLFACFALAFVVRRQFFFLL